MIFSPQKQEVVLFQNVVKTYGKFKALDEITFSIQEKELYGLIGPNGAGKTTAIRVLTGLQRATSGKVEVLGHSPQDPAIWPHLGYMPQETALYLDLTVRQNLELFGRLYGISRNELNHRINELLDFIDLKPWADKLVMKLSGGMKHRASLAVALLPKPKLLILDEPTVGVDPELRFAFWARFTAMCQEGASILITTHYMDEANHCDRIGLVNHGQLIASGTPSDLLRLTKTNSLEDAFLSLARRQKEEL